MLLDADAAAKGNVFFDIGAAEHSDDHALFVYAVDEQGSEYFRIEVKDLATGALLSGPRGQFHRRLRPIARQRVAVLGLARREWPTLPRSSARPARGGEDVLVYAEPDGGMFLSVGVTQSRAYIVLTSGNHETSEARLIPAARLTAEPKVVEPRREGLRYELEHWDGRFVVLTNADGAVDYKLCWADADDPSKATWTDWIAHEPGRFLVGMTAHTETGSCGWSGWRPTTASSSPARDGLAEHTVGFDEEAYALGIDGGYEYDTPVLRFTYQSPTTPRSTYDYDMATRQRTLRKVQEVPSGHDPAAYVARRLHATAPDGGSGPHHGADEGRHAAGRRPPPMLLYGYGAYGIPMEPGFSIRQPQPGGPRLDLGHGARARAARRRAGAGSWSGRKD